MDASSQSNDSRDVSRRGSDVIARWGASCGAAVVGGALMVWLAGLVQVPGAEGASPKKLQNLPELIVTRLEGLPSGGEVRESLRLLDPTPLFMPDARSTYTAAVTTEIAERPGGEVTKNFDPSLTFSNTGATRQILRPVLPQSPLDAATLAGGIRWFDGLARVEEAGRDAVGGPPSLIAAGRVDVYLRGEFKRLATLEVPADATLDEAVWQPVELDVLINAAGAVAAPTVTAGSGVAEVDERVRVLTAQEILPRLRLRPGAYRLVVGP